MANIKDTIGLALAKAGGGVIRTISNINPIVGGKVAKVVDVVGQKLGNPLPETYATQEAMSKGGVELVNKGILTPQQAEQKTIQTTGQPSYRGVVQQKTTQVQNAPSNVSVNPNAVSTLKHERAMGANVGDIREFGGNKWRWNGEVWEPIGVSSSSSSSKPSPQDIAGDVTKRAGETGTTGLLDDDTLSKIIEDVRERGLSVAEAMERRQREAAEERWRLINENLQRQKGEVKTEAERQRGLVKAEEELYRPRIEARKSEELETIGKQREQSDRELIQMKDDLGRSFMDTSRKLQAQFRAMGIATSGFAVGEEAKALRNFNSNLDVLAVKHKDVLEELDKAHRETTRFYNDKLADLEFETRKRNSDIDAWERQQIAAIQANENINLADKLDRIAAAIDRADQIRLQVETNYNNQKLALAQWQKELQTKMALAAQYAAQDNINSAYKQLQASRQLFQDAMTNAWAGKLSQTGEGEFTLSAPTYAGWIPIGTYSKERAEEIEKKKMEPAPSPWQMLLGSSNESLY